MATMFTISQINSKPLWIIFLVLSYYWMEYHPWKFFKWKDFLSKPNFSHGQR